MTARPSSPPKKSYRLLHVIAVVPLLIGGSDFASVYGTRAHALSLPFSSLTYFVPLLAVAAYIVGGLLLRTRLGIIAWIAAYFLGCAIIGVPQLIVTRYAQAIPVTRWLTPQEKTELQLRFPHPYVHYSSSGEGIRLLIRRSDYNVSLLEFLRSIHAYPDA
jgi:hypothetical protein